MHGHVITMNLLAMNECTRVHACVSVCLSVRVSVCLCVYMRVSVLSVCACGILGILQ